MFVNIITLIFQIDKSYSGFMRSTQAIAELLELNLVFIFLKNFILMKIILIIIFYFLWLSVKQEA